MDEFNREALAIEIDLNIPVSAGQDSGEPEVSAEMKDGERHGTGPADTGSVG